MIRYDLNDQPHHQPQPQWLTTREVRMEKKQSEKVVNHNHHFLKIERERERAKRTKVQALGYRRICTNSLLLLSSVKVQADREHP